MVKIPLLHSSPCRARGAPRRRLRQQRQRRQLSGGSDLADLASPGSLVFVEAQLQPKGELKQNIDSVAQVLHRRRRPGRIRHLRTRKLGAPGRRIARLRQGSRTLAGRKGRRRLRTPRRRRTLRTADRDPDDERHRGAGLHRQAHQAGQEPVEETSPTKGSTSRSAARRQRGRPDRRNRRPRPERKGIQSRGRRLEGRIARRRRPLPERDRQRLERQPRRHLRRRRRHHRPVRRRNRRARPRKRCRAPASTRAKRPRWPASFPQSDQIAVDLSSELGGEEAPAGDASKLLGSLPANSFAAFSTSEFNEQLEEAIDSLDEEGIPPDLEPGELKSTLEQAGIDLDKIAASLEEAAVFAEGNSRKQPRRRHGRDQPSPAKPPTRSAASARCCGPRGYRASRRSAARPAASRSAAANSATSRSSSSPKATGSRSATACAPALAGLNGGSGATLSGTLRLQGGGLGARQDADQRLRRRPGGAAARRSARAPFENGLLGSRSLPEEDHLHRPRQGANDEVATAKLIAGIGK